MLTVELLCRSVKEWNKAREVDPDARIELSGIDLRGKDLIEANLSQLDFRATDLSRASLDRANISGANIRWANLSNASLIGASLNSADLDGANLSGANLNGVDFSWANLNGVNLDKADLSNSTIRYTVFADVNLSETVGLENIQHWGPATIGIDTLYKSKGNIPEVFLKGCGIPDNLIEYIHKLTGKAFDYYSCFISYSHKDEDFAHKIQEGLEAKGVRCYYAPHDLPIGAKTRPAIDEAIRDHDKLLIILSEQSVQSNWVEHEVEHALDLENQRKKLVLFPVRIDNAVMDSTTGWAGNIQRQRNIGNFTQWKDHDAYTTAFDRLLRDLQAASNSGEKS